MRSLLVLSSFALASAALAQIQIVPGGTYDVTFDGLPSSGSSAFTPNSGSTLGLYAVRSGTGSNIAADTGAANGGNLYSYGSTGATDRAFGTIGSGTAGNFALGVAFQNSGATAYVDPVISYDLEQWRYSGTAATQVVQFSYGVFTTIPTLVPSAAPTGDNGSGATVQASFTGLAAGNGISPVTSGTAGALDGNLAANRTSVSFTLTGVTIAPGESLVLRFNDPNHAGNDHGLAIDNLRLAPVPEPASMAVLGLGLAALKRRRRSSK